MFRPSSSQANVSSKLIAGSRASHSASRVYASDKFYQRILLANNKTKALTSRKFFLGSFSQTLFFRGREAMTGNMSAVCRLQYRCSALPMKLTIQQPAPSWLVSLKGRALHRYRRGQGFESRTSLNFFFRSSFRNCISCIYNCDGLPSNNNINIVIKDVNIVHRGVR